jgi:hypothetical protein
MPYNTGMKQNSMEYSLTKLERIYAELKEIVEYENKLDMMDQTLNPVDLSKIEDEIIPAIEEIIHYDPTPQYLYDNDGGEPPISAEEMHSGAWRQHQEFHS